MIKDDIEKMRKVAPDLVEKLERGETIEAPMYMKIFHQYEHLDIDSKIDLYALIKQDINNEINKLNDEAYGK